MATPPLVKTINDLVKPITWLLGKWVSNSGKGQYPTIKPFTYGEEIVFLSYGKPHIRYTAHSWNLETKLPMHMESGFMMVKPNTNHVALVTTTSIGCNTIEEGPVVDTSVTFESVLISNMTFVKEPKTLKLHRVFTLKDKELEQVLLMETTNTKLTEHTRATYKKVEEEEGSCG